VTKRIIGAGDDVAAGAVQHTPAVQHLRVDDGGAGQRLDNFLLRVLKGVPKTHVYRVIRSGEVRVNMKRASADTRLVDGDDVRVPPVRVAQRPEVAAAASAPARDFDVLFEDEHLIAINKPAGVAVHGGSGVSYGVIEQLRRARPAAKFLELVHRLDKETSGVMLVAKKRSALTHLQDQFRDRETDKVYAALVFGHWQASKKVIDVPLLKTLNAAGERTVRPAADHDDAKRSITLVKLVKHFPLGDGEVSLLDVTIKTGRTHQIRVHLTFEGAPIVGDPKYGDFERNRALARGPLRFGRMFLHAQRLTVTHPASGERLTVLAPLPAECERLLQQLGPPHPRV
jgi:23S rRNA pseudouridine955/2504/2580 synthase